MKVKIGKSTVLTRYFLCVALLMSFYFGSVDGEKVFAASVKGEGYLQAGDLSGVGKKGSDKNDMIASEKGKSEARNTLGQAAKVIIIGDSRTVNMSKWVMPWVDTVFIAKSGKGYGWFVKEGIPEVNAVRNPGDIIIIWLGVNDYRSPNRKDNPYKVYARKINELSKKEWEDSKIYVSSVGYVDRERNIDYYGKDKRSNVEQIGNKPVIRGISDFNERLKKSLNGRIQWLDCNVVTGIHKSDRITNEALWLTRSNGKKDGLHYSKTTTLSIYDYFMKSILN